LSQLVLGTPSDAEFDSLCFRGLYNDIHRQLPCHQLPELVSREYFMVAVICAILMFATVGLGALLLDQFLNIANNVVSSSMFCKICLTLFDLLLYIFHPDYQ
jgi:hypothetical protein